jgi:hypothetical protein
VGHQPPAEPTERVDSIDGLEGRMDPEHQTEWFEVEVEAHGAPQILRMLGAQAHEELLERRILEIGTA